MSYATRPSRADRARAIGAVVAIHAAAAALLIAGSGDRPIAERAPDTVLIDIRSPPPPPPEPEPRRAPREQGAAGKKANPAPVVAPPPKLPAPSPLRAAPAAGTGASTSSGAASSGSGTGAGGSGNGAGGGGSPAAWLSGGLRDSDYPRDLLSARAGGTVSVRFTVLPSGRIADCRAVRSSGNGLLDGLTCRLLTDRLRFRPAIDGAGRAVASTIGSDYTWGVRQRR